MSHLGHHVNSVRMCSQLNSLATHLFRSFGAEDTTATPTTGAVEESTSSQQTTTIIAVAIPVIVIVLVIALVLAVRHRRKAGVHTLTMHSSGERSEFELTASFIVALGMLMCGETYEVYIRT